MAGTSKSDPRLMMAKAIEVMKQSINESRADQKASPLVGAVLLSLMEVWKRPIAENYGRAITPSSPCWNVRIGRIN